MMAMATAVLLLLALPAGSTGGAQPEAGGLGAPVAAAEVAAEAAAAAEPVTGGPGELLARLADNIDTIDEIFEPAAEAARSNITRTEEASFSNTGPVIGPKREPKGGWCLDDRQKKTWCPQACLSCWKRDHAKTWLETGDDEHLGHVRLVHALDRKEQAVARLRREMQGLRNSTVAMEISAAELAAKLAGKQLWVDVMSELEKVAGLALRELDSMAADGHPEHAAALAGGTEQLKDVLQAVQYSVMLAERARVALSGNAIELVELEVLPCDGAWSEWSSCTNATAAERTCCTPCPKYAKKKTKRQREEAEDYGAGDARAGPVSIVHSPTNSGPRCSTACVNMSTVGVVQRTYHILTPAQHGGKKCPHENGALQLANCSLPAPVCLPKGFRAPKLASAEAAAAAGAAGTGAALGVPASAVPTSTAVAVASPAVAGGSTMAGQLERVIEDAGNAADAAEERHARSASAAVANAVDGGVTWHADGRGEAVVMAELETVVRTGSSNVRAAGGGRGRGSNSRGGAEEIKTGALIDGHDNQYTLMRPHDLTVPHQDIGLIEELLITLGACFVLGAAFRFCGLPSFLGHMAAGTILGPMGLGKLRHMVQLDSLGQLGVELFLFVLGLELDVGAFAAGPTARLSATVAFILTIVLVLGCAAFALTFGTSLSDAVVVGGCLALSSTPVAVGALTKEEHRQPHGELLLGVLIVQDGIFGLFLAILSALGDGEEGGHHGAGGGGGADGSGGSDGHGKLWAGGLMAVCVGCWHVRRRLHHIHNHCCRPHRALSRCWLRCGPAWGGWLLERLLGAVSLTDEAVLLGALGAMTMGRTVTELLGMSGELGCLLMGLSVAPVSSVLFPPGSRFGGGGAAAAAAGAESGREPSPRERVRDSWIGSSPSSSSSPGRFGTGEEQQHQLEEEQQLLLRDSGGSVDFGEADDSRRISTSAAVAGEGAGEEGAPAGAGHGHGAGHGPGGRMVAIVMPVRDLLIALFFASCGQHLSPGFMRELLGTLASLALLAMSLKYLIVAATLRLLSSATASVGGHGIQGTSSSPSSSSGLHLHTVSLTAAGLAQISEVSFFIAARAKRQKLIGRETHFVLLAITSLSLAFAPLLWAVVSFFANRATPTSPSAASPGRSKSVGETAAAFSGGAGAAEDLVDLHSGGLTGELVVGASRSPVRLAGTSSMLQ